MLRVRSGLGWAHACSHGVMVHSWGMCDVSDRAQKYKGRTLCVPSHVNIAKPLQYHGPEIKHLHHSKGINEPTYRHAVILEASNIT